MITLMIRVFPLLHARVHPCLAWGREAGFEYIFYLSLSLTFCSTRRKTVNVCCVAVRLFHYYSRLTCFTSWKHREPSFSLSATFQHRYENPDISFSLNSEPKYRNRCHSPQSCIVASIIRICPNCNIYLHSFSIQWCIFIVFLQTEYKTNRMAQDCATVELGVKIETLSVSFWRFFITYADLVPYWDRLGTWTHHGRNIHFH